MSFAGRPSFAREKRRGGHVYPPMTLLEIGAPPIAEELAKCLRDYADDIDRGAA